MAWLGSSQMGEAELLAVPPSFLMDWESHPQLCCCQVRNALFRLLLLAYTVSPLSVLPFVHTSIHFLIHLFNRDAPVPAWCPLGWPLRTQRSHQPIPCSQGVPSLMRKAEVETYNRAV